MILIIILLSIFHINNSLDSFKLPVRIVEGTDKLSDKSNLQNDIYADQFYGPESLYFLNSFCFSKCTDRYEYTICPFHNVTQRRLGQMTSAVIHLGYWGSWIDSIDQLDENQMVIHKTMKYTRGNSCGHASKSSIVNLICDSNNDISIKTIDDKSHCEYLFDVYLPLSCNLLLHRVHDNDNRLVQPIKPNVIIPKVEKACECPVVNKTCNDEINIHNNTIDNTNILLQQQILQLKEQINTLYQISNTLLNNNTIIVNN